MATMEVEEVQKLVKRLSTEAASRQSGLRRWIIWLVVLVVTVSCVFCTMLFQQGESINDLQASNIALSKTNAQLTETARDLSDTLNRRSPVLDHLFCRDDIEDQRGSAKADRDRKQTVFLFQLLNAGDEVTPEESQAIQTAGDEYLAAENIYLELWNQSENPCPQPELPKG